MTDLQENAAPAKRVAFLAFLSTWATLWLAWVCVTITRSYLHYGDVVPSSQMWLLPLAVLPLVLALPAIVTLGLERFGLLSTTTLMMIAGACTSALQAFIILEAFGDDPLFAGYSRPLLVMSNLIPGAAWGLVYSGLTRRRRK
jgi:hypothetical protein